MGGQDTGGGISKRRVQLGRLQRARGLWHEAWKEGRSGQKGRCWTWGAPGKEGTRRVREKENGALQRWGRGKLRGAAGHARGASRKPASPGTPGGTQGRPESEARGTREGSRVAPAVGAGQPAVPEPARHQSRAELVRGSVRAGAGVAAGAARGARPPHCHRPEPARRGVGRASAHPRGSRWRGWPSSGRGSPRRRSRT